MKKSIVFSLAFAIGSQLLAEPAKSPQVRLENPEQIQIMWQTANSWPLGGIRINKAGDPGSTREVWMEHDDDLNYYRGYDHWVFLNDLEDGASYQYYLLGKDNDGNIKRMVDTPYSFDYPDYAKPINLIGGPFLTNPGTHAISVVWRTDTPAGAAVELRKQGTAESSRFLSQEAGIFTTHNTQHVVSLKGLDSGTDYEYRPMIYDPRNRTFIVAGEWQGFTTLSADKERFRTLFLSDFHGDRNRLEKLLEKYSADTCDFILYGGDMIWNAMHAPDAENLWDEFINSSVKYFAGHVPLVMSRGNHECGGMFADSYIKVFHTAEGNTFHAFRAGKTFFVILDSGDISPQDQDCFSEMFEKQRTWLQGILNTEECKTAIFRVMVVHAPTHGMPDDKINARMRYYFQDILNEASPERRFQLCLGGHEHRYFRVNAGERINRGEAPSAGKNVFAENNYEYTVMLNGGPLGGNWEYTVIEMVGDSEKLQLNLYDSISGKLIDAISIDPAGKVTELGSEGEITRQR